MEKSLNKAKQKLQPEVDHGTGTGSSTALGQHVESSAAVDRPQNSSQVPPEIQDVVPLGSLAADDVPLPVMPRLASSSAHVPAHPKYSTLPSTIKTTQSAVEELLEAQNSGSNLFVPLEAALTGIVRVGELVERDWEVDDMFSALGGKVKAFAIVAHTCGTNEIVITDDVENYLRVIAVMVQLLWCSVSNRVARPEVHDQDVGQTKSLVEVLTSLLRIFDSVDNGVATDDLLAVVQESISLRNAAVAVERAAGIINRNSNMNYNFGGDIINNNWVINFSAPSKMSRAAQDQETVRKIKSIIGDRFVPSAVDDTQPKDAGCLPGTRKSVLAKFVAWVKDDPMRIFWLAGLAGTGKTSIAVTLCNVFQAERETILLGGAFFCSRTANDDARTDARRVIPTLATILAERSSSFATALVKELHANSRAALKPIEDQIDALLKQPLAALASTTRIVVFIIDALDECKEENDVKKLLLAITSLNCDAKVKFILTSRPETHISATPISNSDLNSILRLHTISLSEVTEDIRLYTEECFSKQPLDEMWYSERDIKALATLASGLFIFSATIIKYVLIPGSANARKNRLQKILSAAKSVVAVAPLDAMYEFVMTRASDTSAVEPEELEATQQVLACILAARMPLSVASLAELLVRRPNDLGESLRRLHAVVNVPESYDEPELRTLHASFGDYLLNRAATNIRIHPSLGHDLLARSCLQRMARHDLCFNVSRSRSSYTEQQESNGYAVEREKYQCNEYDVDEQDVQDEWDEEDDEIKGDGEDGKVEERPTASIASHLIARSLAYACLHWAHHIDAASDVPAFDLDIERIFCPKLLFWLEVLSVLKKVAVASGLLRIAVSAVKRTGVSQFLRDANSFVASSREAIERSAPHIYLSALPFAAKDSLVYKTFAPHCTGVVSIETLGIDRHGGQLVTILTGHEGAVNSVAYSPNGLFIASGSQDSTVRIWDIRTGEEATSPLRSGDGPVYSVAYSPHARHLAYGTEAGIVCVCSPLAKQEIPQRLSGHSEAVYSVIFSPDGLVLASASRDRTVRLWNPDAGQQISLLEGHTDFVLAVAFSPDGEILTSSSNDSTIRLWHRGENRSYRYLRCPDGSTNGLAISPDSMTLVSGSNDHLIRLWSMQDRKVVRILHGHSDLVQSVRFSPDGHFLVSAGDDASVRLWSVRDSEGDVHPILFDGHTDSVNFATFSPDGLYIASASDDMSIRIWDAKSDHSVGQPLHAHHGKVNSVVISAQGTLIVSGSDDRSVRVWGVLTGDLRLAPPLRHTHRVFSVAISPDGHIIASGSGDHAVWLWCAHTGAVIGKPLQGHKSSVDTLAFSSDGQWLASGSGDCTVCIWVVASRQASTVGPLYCCREVGGVAFSPNGRILAAGASKHIYLWHSKSGLSVCEPLQTYGENHSISFSLDGTKIASCGYAFKAYVWNVATGQCVLTLDGHNRSLNSVAFSPDGCLIGSGSSDRTIRLWTAETGAQVVTLYGHSECVTSIAFTPDGRSIVSCSNDETIRVWDIEAARSATSVNTRDLIAALSTTGLCNGWLLGPRDELLLWVPPDYRAHLSLPHNTLISRRRITINADAGVLHAGEDWTLCWQENVHIY